MRGKFLLNGNLRKSICSPLDSGGLEIVMLSMGEVTLRRRSMMTFENVLVRASETTVKCAIVDIYELLKRDSNLQSDSSQLS